MVVFISYAATVKIMTIAYHISGGDFVMLLSFLLALSLSLDALGVGLSYGLRHIRFPFVSRLLLALETALLLYLFLRVGALLAKLLPFHLAQYLAIAFLLGFGCWLCIQGLRTETDSDTDISVTEVSHTDFAHTQAKQKKAALGVLSFLRTPSRCDKDDSASLEPKEALLLGLVLSADACGVGISAGAAALCVVWLPLWAALTQTCFLAIGCWIGHGVSTLCQIPEQRYCLLSGVIFLGIGVTRLLSLLG